MSNPYHRPPTSQQSLTQGQQQARSVRTILPKGIRMLSRKEMTSRNRPVLQDKTNSNRGGYMTPSATDDCSTANSLFSTNHHRGPRDSYGVPTESPSPSAFWKSSDIPSAADHASPYLPKRRIPSNANMPSPTDEDMYLDDDESILSSQCSSVEEANDMYTFATAAASILQQAREEEEEFSLPTSPEESSVDYTAFTPTTPAMRYQEDTPVSSKYPTPGDKDTPLARNTNTLKNEMLVSPYRRDIPTDDDGHIMIPWEKTRPPTSDPSARSLPSMLGGEPGSSNSSVAELESPALFLESSMGDQDTGEFDAIQSPKSVEFSLDNCKPPPNDSPKSVEFSLDLCQANPVATTRDVSTSNPRTGQSAPVLTVKEEEINDTVPGVGSSTATDAVATNDSENMIKLSGGDIEVPTSGTLDGRDDGMAKEPSEKNNRCQVPSWWKIVALFLLACTVLIPIFVGKWRNRTETSSNLAKGDEADGEVPTVTPIEPLSEPTPSPSIPPLAPSVEATPSPTLGQASQQPVSTPSPTGASQLRPTSSGNAPIGRPSAMEPLTPEPAPTLSPIWTSVQAGEDELESFSLSEIHWPHYQNNNGLRLEIVNTLDDHWQVDLAATVETWNSLGSINLTIVNASNVDEENCEPVWGKIKICNHDYGETNWRGMVQVFFRSGNIVATSIRVNDFYAMERGWAQYTLCHQLGHSFGLGDSLNFNCMKRLSIYNEAISLQLRYPDDGIGLLLKNAYGKVGGRRLKGSFLPAEEQETTGYDKVMNYFT
eukprot:scaffold368_cov125-Cylindrotheca_fusiformis.AAC.14